MWVATISPRLDAGQGMLQPLVEQHAVGQPGQGVVQCEVAGAIGQLQHMADVLTESALQLSGLSRNDVAPAVRAPSTRCGFHCPSGR